MFEGQTPEITYPCEWPFKLIGPDEVALRKAVTEVLADRVHTIIGVTPSRKGRYKSLRVEVVVFDEAERKEVGDAFHAHPATLFVF